MSKNFILIEGARQNNLKGLDLKLPLHELIVVTGVSGSGKSSLAFDTVYAEGQRRYVETFSPYARQFLDRMDKPRADRIEGIPPAIAIDQTNPVRTSRSTVGTMTELNDHLKLLFARAAALHCRGCGRRVQRDTPESIAAALLEKRADPSIQTALIAFPVRIPPSFSAEEMKDLLAGQGYTRIHREENDILEVIADRIRLEPGRRPRIVEAVEASLRHGQGRVNVYSFDDAASLPRRFSADRQCPDCDIHNRDPPLADREQPGMPGRLDPLRAKAERSDRPPMARSERRAAPMGDRWGGKLAREEMVRGEAVLPVAGGKKLQNAHPRPPLEVPRLQSLPRLRRGSAGPRRPPLAARNG
jgi:excinuclease ABC subunit A